MKTGFYIELEELREDDKTANWGFLENTSIDNPFTNDEEYNMNAFDFLHGFCNVFAYALNQMFGFDIKVMNNKDGLVHAFCTATVNGETAYIDVRGITTDFKEFAEPFDDYTSIESADIADVYDSETEHMELQYAKSLIDDCGRQYKF